MITTGQAMNALLLNMRHMKAYSTSMTNYIPNRSHHEIHEPVQQPANLAIEAPSRSIEARQGSYMALLHKPASDAAIAFVAALAGDLWRLTGRKRARPTRKFVDGLGAVFAELVRTWNECTEHYCYRSTQAGTFTGGTVGYEVFMIVITSMERAGYVAWKRGFHRARQRGKIKSEASRFQATETLINAATKAGVTITAPESEFRRGPRPALIPQPLILKAGKVKERGQVQGGQHMRVNFDDPKVVELARTVSDINAFFATQKIEPDRHYVFYRVFNQGDDPAFAWNKGGRLISAGVSYQQMSQVDRKLITIDGEATSEIDLRASHLTILHALLGVSFDPIVSDPYISPHAPRDVTKMWTTMTLGHNRYHRFWSRANKEKYAATYGGDLQKDFPISMMNEEMPKLINVLNDWPGCPVRWGDLQFAESEVVVGAVHTLATVYSVPALPVHDSIIVPLSQEEIATTVLSDTFQRHIGIRPYVTSK